MTYMPSQRPELNYHPKRSPPQPARRRPEVG